MSKPKWGKLSRREGIALHPKADKVLSRRAYAPGQHGLARARKVSEYARRLREKQKVKRMYGLSEAQFRRFFNMAVAKKGVTGEIFLMSLELRLDNVVFRSHLTKSRPAARQLIGHGHILVNGNKVDIPSYILKSGDVIAVATKSKETTLYKTLAESLAVEGVPKWIKLTVKDGSAEVVQLPARDDLDASIDEQLIIEFYSR